MSTPKDPIDPLAAVKIINLTPHSITTPITLRPDEGPWTLAPSGVVANVIRWSMLAAPIGDIPTSRVSYGAIENLPNPEWIALPSPCDVPGAVPEGSRWCLVCGAQDGHHPPPRAVAVYYVVSSVVVEAARRAGRAIEDLLVPGQQIRDEAAGYLVEYRSLTRVG